MTSRAGADGGPHGVGSTADAPVLFALGLGMTALFHLAGNPRPSFASPGIALTLVQLGVGAAALWSCFRPRAQLPLLLLCGLIPISAWLEAPVVGNHWVLAAVMSITYLIAGAAGGRNPLQPHRGPTWSRFVPAARSVLLIAYGMAAFAKLNTDFFDPVTSCAVFYHDQLVSSWGLDGLSSLGRPLLGRGVALAASLIELSVPLLLLVRRTRRAGLLVALSFHWLIALDLSQHFWDFSSVLFVAFLLFLDGEQVQAVVSTLRDVRAAIRPSARLVLASTGVLAAAAVTASAALPVSPELRGTAVLLGHLSWMLVGTGVLVVVAVATARTPASPERLALPAAALLVVPVLVALNGLTPYLELKTGFGWNMYSNLRTVSGETNHLLVPATFDLTGLQSDTVEILASSDPALAELVGTDYAVVYSELREYAHDHPDASVTYRRNERIYDASRMGDDPAGRGDVSELSRRLQSFRVVDTSGAERCQAVFTPAR